MVHMCMYVEWYNLEWYNFLSGFDPNVLNQLLSQQNAHPSILKIIMTHIHNKENHTKYLRK